MLCFGSEMAARRIWDPPGHGGCFVVVAACSGTWGWICSAGVGFGER